MDKKERLKLLYQYYKERGYTQKTFAEGIGLSRPQLCNLLFGNTPINKKHELLLHYVYNVNIDWLNHGKGEMIIYRKLHTDNSEIVEISNAYTRLSEDSKNILYEISKCLLVSEELKSGKAKKALRLGTLV